MYMAENIMVVHSDAAPVLEERSVHADHGEDGTRNVDPNADLFGDWCWKPDRYPSDPGKVYTESQVQAVYPYGLVFGAPSLHHAAIFGADYAGIAERPSRIGPNVG